MITAFVLLLSWMPATGADKPIMNHMVYADRETCERNIEAMKKVFEMMQNPTAVMICQPLNQVSK
jgi:hypothetical protein